jgi:hypothetical protein
MATWEPTVTLQPYAIARVISHNPFDVHANGLERSSKPNARCRGGCAMKRALAVLAAGAIAVAAATIPAPAQARHFGPGLAFGLAAGALAAGAIAASGPYGYGPGYGYYGPGYGYYGPSYYYEPGPYAYYGGPYVYRHRYWRHHW